MIPHKRTTTVDSSNISGEKSSYRIADVQSVLRVLRSNLYSLPIEAVIREFSTNACDAHIEAGDADRPIEVTIPTYDNSQFIVRDFGLGLSHDDMMKHYTGYGASGKRHTNALNGTLGLGCKCWAAYSDTATIISRHEGVKCTYSAFIGEDELGTIQLIHTEYSDEPSGLEVIIPVKTGDITTFRTTASSVYYHFSVRPKISGGTVTYNSDNAELQGTNWKYLGPHSGVNTRVVMGNVGYRIDWNDKRLNKKLNKYLKRAPLYDWVFYVPNGSLEFSASRENLYYTESTTNALVNVIKDIHSEIESVVQKAVDDCNTFQCAMYTLDRIKRTQAKNFNISDDIKWKGIPLNVFSVSGDTQTQCNIKTTVYSADTDHNNNVKIKIRRFKSWQNAPSIRLDKDTLVLAKDETTDIRSRIAKAVDNYYAVSSSNTVINTVYVMELNDKTKKPLVKGKLQEFIDATGLSSYDVVFTSDCVVNPTLLVKNKKQKSSYASHKNSVFTVKPRPDIRNYGAPKSSNWDIVDPDYLEAYKNGHYVLLNRFVVDSTVNEYEYDAKTFSYINSIYKVVEGKSILAIKSTSNNSKAEKLIKDLNLKPLGSWFDYVAPLLFEKTTEGFKKHLVIKKESNRHKSSMSDMPTISTVVKNMCKSNYYVPQDLVDHYKSISDASCYSYRHLTEDDAFMEKFLKTSWVATVKLMECDQYKKLAQELEEMSKKLYSKYPILEFVADSGAYMSERQMQSLSDTFMTLYANDSYINFVSNNTSEDNNAN